MPKITELYAFISIDNNDPNDEGIIGMNFNGHWMPFMGGDLERVESLKPYAEMIKKETGVDYKIKYFKIVD